MRKLLNSARQRSAAERRRGSIAVIAAWVMVFLLALGALAIDVAYMRLAQAQAQDIADAAAVAGLWALRSTGDEGEAQTAAEAVIAANVVGGRAADLATIEVGDWSREDQQLFVGEDSPNAVRVRVSRTGTNALPLFLGSIFGPDQVDIAGQATAAARNLQVVIVFDITNSWRRPDFYYARDAAIAFYETIERSHGPDDRIGMNVFTGRYAWEFTPFIDLDTAEVTGEVLSQWSAMETASKAGTYNASHSRGCNVFGSNHARRDDFTSPCFPNMPREWIDEPGTDHTIGMVMAREMFEDDLDDTSYRAVVVLTDGYPSGTSGSNFQDRIAAGYQETRWDEAQAVVPHTTAEIKSESVTLAEEMWEDLEVHTFVVSFVADDAFMENMTQGDGYYVNTTDSSALVDIFENIAESLPLAIVE